MKKQYWGRHLWARGYFAVTSGTITDEMMINEYINEQEGEAVQDDSRFEIDPSRTPRLKSEGRSVTLSLDAVETNRCVFVVPYPTRQPTRGGGPMGCLRGKRTQPLACFLVCA